MTKTIYRKRGSRKAEDRVEAVQWVGFNMGQYPKGADNRPAMPEWFPPLIQEVWDREETYDDPNMKTPEPGDAWKCGKDMIRIGLEGERQFTDAKPGDFILRYPSGALATMKGDEFRHVYRAV